MDFKDMLALFDPSDNLRQFGQVHQPVVFKNRSNKGAITIRAATIFLDPP